MKLKMVYFLLLLSPLTLIFGYKGGDKKQRAKITTNDHYAYININSVLMWVSNNGDGSHDPRTDASGYYWPDESKAAIFEDGLVFGAMIGDSLFFNGNTHRQGLQAGKIINGQPDDPKLAKYRVYKIRKDWESFLPGPERTALEKDYNEWPIEDGAPYIDVDKDGKPTPGVDKPEFIGDETLWYVSNDMDSNRTTFTYGSYPIGLEIQTTVWGYNTLNTLGDAVFKKYKIINKRSEPLHDMYLGYWSDPDMGDANDDYCGCDTSLNMGFTFNATNNDGIYGSPPPAQGYTLLQGPVVPGNPEDTAQFLGGYRRGMKNLPMTSFVFYIGGSALYRDPSQGLYSGSGEFYNYLQGKLWNGEDIIDPTTGEPVVYILAGDPVSRTGWYEGQPWPIGYPPADRRFLLSSGPFNMAPGDTQEIVIAIHMALGTDNINSITRLRQHSRNLKDFYSSDIIREPDAPRFYAVPEEGKINLWWEGNAEEYTFTNIFLSDTIFYDLAGMQYIIPVNDTTYNFEGYRIWQYKDTSGTDPRLLATFDLQDSISHIYAYPFEAIRQDIGPLPAEFILVSPDSGLSKFLTVTKDAYTGSPLYSGSEYYFSVTAYGYNKYSDPPILESIPQIIKVTPGRPAIDESTGYTINDSIQIIQTSGSGDGNVVFRVIDPYSLKDHHYRIEINGAIDTTVLKNPNTSYNLIDVTAGDTIISYGKDFLFSTVEYDDFKIPETQIRNKNVYDGFITLVHQQGVDSIEWIDRAIGGKIVGVKGIYEVAGPGGSPLMKPLPVFRSLNSTAEWQVDVSYVTLGLDPIQSLNYTGATAIGYRDYELRFTGTSQYYLLYNEAQYNNSPKGIGTVPFQVWRLGNNLDATSKRMYIKIQDINGDGQWSYIDTSQSWEPIYAFRTDAPYIEEIPVPSPSAPGTKRAFGRLVFKGGRPAEGSILRLEAWQPLSKGDVFEVDVKGPRLNDPAAGKQNINNISAFPNPYYAAEGANGSYPEYIRFTNLPYKVTIRIFTLAGVYINKFDKEGPGQYIDWDLRNKDGSKIGSGIYIVYIEMPGIGNKIMKLAVLN